MAKEDKQILNVDKADQDKVKIAISRWNQYLFSKESDKNLFEYFLESTKKSNLLPQYANIFLENCIVWAINKIETTPMHHNMRLKQSFQFLIDNTTEFNLNEQIVNYLCEKSSGFQVKRSNSYNYLLDNYNWFSQLSSVIKYKSSKDNEFIKFILEKVLEKASLDTVLNSYKNIEQSVLNEVGSIFASSLINKIEKDSSLSDDIILSIHYMENKTQQLCLIENILLCPHITQSELLSECWDICSNTEKEIIIGKSLMLEVQNPAIETLSDYKQYVKNILESDLINHNIQHHSNTVKNKKKIELYFSLLEELYETIENDQTRESIQNYAREMYIKIIAQKRPDLIKGLINIKAEKSIIKTEDVPLFVYQIMDTFPKVMSYHLVVELLDSVKKVGKIKEFSDVFNTSKNFQVGHYNFQFSEDMKNEIKYIYHDYLTEKLQHDKKNIINTKVKRLKI